MSSIAIPNPSFAQRWRKPLSILCAIVWLTVAVGCVPRGFATGWHELIEYVGFLLLIIAAQGRIWAMVYIVGRKNRELCQSGPYSLMRNPLYLFSFIGVVGLALSLQHVLLGLISGVIFLGYYAAVIRGEEKILESIHGSAFREYCARVPRFWPRVAWPDGGSNLLTVHVGPFMRGLREVFWFLAIIIFAEILEWVHLNPAWQFVVLPF